MKSFFSALLILCSTIIFGQNTLSGDVTSQKAIQDVWFRKVFEVKIEDVLGTPYYSSKFVPAKVSGHKDGISARYNIYHDNMEFIQDGKIMVIPKVESYNDILLISDNSRFKLLNNGYYVAVYDSSKYQILKKLKVRFQNYVPARNGYEDDKPAKFIPLPATYYIKIGDNLQEIPKSTKKFAELFPEKQEKLLQFMKDNKTKLNSDESLRSVMRFLEK